MGLVEGFPLCQCEEIDEPTVVYDNIMKLIVRLARYGIIHGDLNEFNLLISNSGEITLIDFPQMVSTSHKNAEYYFDRDVRGVVDFFKRKFDFESIERVPKFSDVKREYNMDEDLKASGYSKMVEEAIEEELRPIEEESEGSDEEGSDENESDENDEIEEKPEVKAPVIDNSRLGKWCLYFWFFFNVGWCFRFVFVATFLVRSFRFLFDWT
jgi:RIO kinase 2